MTVRSAILGTRFVLGSTSPVNGLVLFPSANHFSISARSYVWPSTVMTGSLITSIVNGHSKTKEATAPAAAGSAGDMLSAGTGAGASGAAADPRAAVEAAVSAAPDDPSEGDKLNLAMNIASASATDIGTCSTSACRSGSRDPAATLAPAAAAPASYASVSRRTKWRVDSFWML
jgi:hypothetical protein